jgi:tRNA threonylcarbamoyl adenosine modification protein YjeE
MLRALGVSGAIKSPTYTLIERYTLDRGEAAHLDLYRIAQSGELEFLGLHDLAPELRLWLVEWPERGQGALPQPDIEVELRVEGEGRQARLEARSPVGRDWLEALARAPREGSLERPS